MIQVVRLVREEVECLVVELAAPDERMQNLASGHLFIERRYERCNVSVDVVNKEFFMEKGQKTCDSSLSPFKVPHKSPANRLPVRRERDRVMQRSWDLIAAGQD
ncbi:hypothetical protein ABZ589_21105 [Streptomyces sp. NPDC013313]|uniref:hypothetical protein n=1 Tax=Streptomyces sp. NPDC013313 TaxID=3155603 RepID=UPI0034040ECA